MDDWFAAVAPLGALAADAAAELSERGFVVVPGRQSASAERCSSPTEPAARAAGGRGIDVETQDINVPACRLYAAHGYVLSSVVPDAYVESPGETKLVWTKRFD